MFVIILAYSAKTGMDIKPDHNAHDEANQTDLTILILSLTTNP